MTDNDQPTEQHPEIPHILQALTQTKTRTQQAKTTYLAALAAEHRAIRIYLDNAPRGTQKALIDTGLYSRAHLARIKKGKTSGH